MKSWKAILVYGLSLAGLVFFLKFIEYRFLVRDLSLEFYVGIVAFFFTAIGVWAGLRITRRKVPVAETGNFQINTEQLERLGISKREYDVLELMAKGLSNQEIADKLFVSVNTVKTHSSNIFVKLDARRRTQAIQRAKELHLIP
jgi:two-component system, NarL family, response regulator LiaR